MLNSVLVLTFRNFLRNFNYSIITLGGLVVGISTALLIFLWVSYELSYDREDPDNNRVFVVMHNELFEGEIQTNEGTYAPLTDFLLTEVPEVEAMTRVNNAREQLNYQDRSLSKEGIYADTGFFKVFKPKVIAGDAVHPLPDNYSIALSQEVANLLFKDIDAVGKFISIGGQREFKVTSVYSNYPDNSSNDYVNYILPFHAKHHEPDEWQDYYIKLYQAETKTTVEQRIDAELKEFFGNENTKSYLFCLTDWRLHWNFKNGKPSGGRIVYVIIFSITAVFILLMACVNYMNLATARATKRAREIGVRKMTGATQHVLIRQFLGESMMLSCLATAVSVLVVFLMLPLFRELMGLPLQFTLTDPLLLLGLLGITLFTGLIAGSYPAFMLSAFKPASILKGNIYSSLTGARLRSGLVVFQFVLSIVMIFGALIMWQQTNFLLKKDVGYDKHNVINVWINASVLNIPLQAFREEIANHPSVVSASYGGASPMEVNGYAEVKWAGMTLGTHTYLYGATTDFDMVPVLRMKIVQGRNFSRDLISDSSNFIINKRAAEVMGFENPIGQRVTYTMFGEQQGEIIGVIEDFNNDDIHLPIAPVLFCIGSPKYLGNLFVRYHDGQLDAALENLKKVFNKYQPGIFLNYSFLDSDYEMQLYREKFLGRLSAAFTVIAIIIACLGLFGLTMFNAERRTKEIGIRKVLGATVRQVVVLLCREFLKPVLISFVIAFPLAYYFMQQYLEDFAFRVSITVFSFLIVGGAMFLLVMLAVFHQAFKAAVKNPVEALKTE